MIQPLKSSHRTDLNSDELSLEVAELAPVLAITKNLFPGPVRVRSECDPSFPDDVFYSVFVIALGSSDDVLSRHEQWHQQVASAMGHDHEIRLAIERA